MARTFSQHGGKLTLQKETSPSLKALRKKGRPKLRWHDNVLKDVKLLKVETWWKKAHDRNIWGKIIKEAKVHKGLRDRGR
jgi:hypothetical protein